MMNSSIERPWQKEYIRHVGRRVRYGVPLPCGAGTMQAILSVFENVLDDN